LAWLPLGGFIWFLYFGVLLLRGKVNQQQFGDLVGYGIPAMIVLSSIGGVLAAWQSRKWQWILIPIIPLAILFFAFLLIVASAARP
jgi:hypothetical protein